MGKKNMYGYKKPTDNNKIAKPTKPGTTVKAKVKK